MKAKRILVGLAALCAAGAAVADTPLELYPVRVGHETARYDRGRANVLLTMPGGAVELRPLPVEHGRVMLALAVFNESDRPANFGISDIVADVNGIPVRLPSYEQLVDAAKKDARGRKIGTALVAGTLAAVASTADREGYYRRSVHTPHGTYTRTITWHDDTPGVVGASVAVAGGAMVIHGIDRKLDYTLDQLSGEILRTTTVDPGTSFGGQILVPLPKGTRYPADIGLRIMWNGTPYHLALRLTPAGVDVPPSLPATPMQAMPPGRAPARPGVQP